jgi:hypothetical protein
VTPPDDLTVPAVDLGSVTVTALGNFSGAGAGGGIGSWDGDRPDGGYSPGWLDPSTGSVAYSGGYYDWWGSGSYGWSTAYFGDNLSYVPGVGWTPEWWHNVGYGFWSDAGFAGTGGILSNPPSPVPPAAGDAIDPSAVVSKGKGDATLLLTAAGRTGRLPACREWLAMLRRD